MANQHWHGNPFVHPFVLERYNAYLGWGSIVRDGTTLATKNNCDFEKLKLKTQINLMYVLNVGAAKVIKWSLLDIKGQTVLDKVIGGGDFNTSSLDLDH